MKLSTNKFLKNNLTRKIIKLLYEKERENKKTRLQELKRFKTLAEIQELRRQLQQKEIQIQQKEKQKEIQSLQCKSKKELLIYLAENQINDQWNRRTH